MQSLVTPGDTSSDTGDYSTTADDVVVATGSASLAQQQDALLRQLFSDGEAMGNCSAFLRKW